MENGPIEVTIDYDSLSITCRQIQQIMGYRDTEAPEPIPQITETCLKRVAEICKIRAGYVVVEATLMDQKSQTIQLNDPVGRSLYFYVGKIVFGQLRRANKVIAFVCTAGSAISNWSKELMTQGNLLEGYIVDMIGSEVVESAMDLFQNAIETKYQQQGFKITNRYSPGYCNWHVSEQQKLFRLLPVDFCGIKLLPSSLMQPAKSISGFIGLGENVKRNNYQCSICDMEDCIYRKQKAKP